MSMTFTQTVDYLNERLKYGIKPGTGRIEALLEELDNPHRKYKTLLITGTNGKTSTAKMASALLVAQDYQVGLYTSPHLHSYCERISFNNRNIDEGGFGACLEEIKPAIKKTDKKLADPLTNFEITTALAFHYFAKAQADTVVCEVGMGARFDATCLTKAAVSIITNVDIDHTDYLGTSVEKIATEKSFVIKKRSNAVVGDLKTEALEVIQDRCRQMSAQLYVLNEDFCLRSSEMMPDFSQTLSIDSVIGRYRHINLQALGHHQAINLSLAIAAAELFHRGSLTYRKFKHPLSQVVFEGRLEILQHKPLIVVDGAHNKAGAKSLARFLANELEYGKLIIVLAVYKDKDYAGIIEELQPIANHLIFSENSSGRSAKAADLAKQDTGCQVIVPLKKAIEEAKRLAGSNDLICLTGSLGTVAEARETLLTKTKSEK